MENKPVSGNSRSAEAIVSGFMEFYENYSMDNIANLDEVYTQDIEFIDPVHRIQGMLALKKYMKKLINNMQHYRIRYLDSIVGENTAYVTWEMDYSHKRIKNGRLITLRGITQIKYTAKVYYHEDCYDLGALLYDHLPVLGPVIQSIKKRLARA